ncbi:MAG: Long-chain-fatty-acid--CoA ligase FadD15 [Syntrophaceae bacterium PtaB.Bin095]|nr:MAG: Long-chain-fatty-acid--CoA ligase FadD15 [Syntrophaceae bacterium PtaB.Bin095]
MQQYKYEKPDNLVEFLENSVARFSDRPLFGTRRADGQYEWITYRDFGRRVDNLRGGLAARGIGKGDVVGIIANNRVEWAAASFATHGLNARFVPMYEQELLHVWEYIVRDSGVKLLFVSKPAILEQVKDFPGKIETLQKIILIDGEGADTLASLEKEGEARPIPAVHPAAYNIATLIYTSGTTGDPKGVLLSHGNWTHNSHGRARLYPGYDHNDRVLSILPWAHTYGQGEMHTFLQFGASIALMGSTATLAGDMMSARPTFLIAVPRVFNKIYEGLWAKMNETGGLARTLFVMGVEAGKKRRALAEKGRSDFLTDLKFKLADRIVFAKIRERFGGRLRAAMTASAMMNMEILLFFLDLGIPVYDCYGMTETSPGITLNGPTAWRVGSVGKPIYDVRVVIDSSMVEEGARDGEILCYGPNVMQGYHNKPEQTKEVMTEDGGIRTGDRGRLDGDGFLFITGRIKEQFKLENGKFVFPAALEEDIGLIPSVQNALIYGDNRPFTVCLVVPDFFFLERYAEKQGLPADMKTLIERRDVQDMIAGEITRSLKGKYGGYEIPKKFLFLKENFTLENGMLTQTMKLKRRVVLTKYMDQIEALYK